MSKSSKHRLCPALGREISRSECGENRQSRYACPASCPHNPFALENYTALLTSEDVLDRQTMSWMFNEARDRSAFEHGMQTALRANDSGESAHAFVSWNLFFRRDGRGLTCAQRLAEARFSGFNNDERVFLKAKMQMRVILFEVHRVLDDQRIEAIDLLAPEAAPIIIVDRSLAARATRFSTLLGWAYPLPHFWRLSGSALSVADVSDFEPTEVITQMVRHLGGPVEIGAMRQWLAEHFVRMSASMSATAKERQRLMMARMDMQFGMALYALQAPFAECRAALDAEPEIDRDEPTAKERDEGFAEARDWFDDTSPTKDSRKLLGRILLGQAFWRLEATGAARLANLRKRFEQRLGKRMRFDRERRDDLGARMTTEIPEPDLALVPPQFLQNPMQVEFSTSRVAVPIAGGAKTDIESHFMREHLRKYADQPVPAFDGKTPRQATGNPALRKKLLHFLKLMVRQIDETNLRTGRTDDINGLLRELGLAEIDFPPPPRRTPQPEAMGDLPDDAEPSAMDSRPPAKPLPPVPLSDKEVSKRMRTGLAGFATATAAINELTASGSTLLDDAAALTKESLSESEFGFFISFLLQGWFTLVSPGTQAPELDYEAMLEELTREMDQIHLWVAGGPEATMSNLVSGSRQPALLQFLIGTLFDSSTKAPEDLRPDHKALIPMIAVLKIVINEVDRALRTR